LPTDVLDRVDRICDRFEAAWESGARPRIEDHLEGVAAAYRPELLRDLLAAELAARRRRGEQPEPHEYRDRFPGEVAVIAMAFDSPAIPPYRLDSRTSPPSHTRKCVACQAEVLEGSRFCPGCGRALAAPCEATASVPVREAGDELGVGRDSLASCSSDSSHRGYLLPGTRIADRYRIVSLLGRGGMGEVYRTDDLKLGQAVALKFLPKDLADDSRRLQAFHDEVRLARQISHPNVCRVHDIGEVEGRHFLSMEYIDGEDLRGLLRRIGRLPKDKGIEIARQLCAGLSAAHEKGVLHRDLKPANIMLDGRGQVRITDYGLARSIGEGDRSREIAGTPAYMAPEQLSRGETSIQSDLYSLGLVLYEVFTGRRVHEFGSIAELTRAHEESSVTPPSSVAEDVDPALEQVILRCLEKDPRDRPRSARAVAAALPGGDPLAAALAAGETPSPGLVAAAGEPGELSRAVAGACLAVVAAGLIVVSLLAQRTMLVNRAPMEMPPDALEFRAREIIKRLGYVDPPAHSARGFEDAPADREAIKRADLPQGDSDRRDLLKSGPWPGLRFRYRQSPKPMVVNAFWNAHGDYSRTKVDADLPPWDEPGMAGVRLDPRGKLRWFRAIPPERAAIDAAAFGRTRNLPAARESAEPGAAGDLPWSAWFREEDLGFNLTGRYLRRLSDESLWTAAWLRTPRDAYDRLAAWQGTWPDSAAPLHVEAAAYRGRPVYFAVFAPSPAGEAGMPGSSPPRWDLPSAPFWFGLDLAIFCGEMLLAWRNLRLGRGDRRGALRLARYIFVLSMLSWLLQASHFVGPLEWMILLIGVAQALFASAFTWLHYIALEPIVRRAWPQTLISWSRLLNGRLRDARVGRDLVLGAVLGVLASLLMRLSRIIPAQFGLASGWDLILPVYPSGTASLIGVILDIQIYLISMSLIFLLILAFLRLATRSVRLAACGLVALNTVYFCMIDPEATYATGLCSALAVMLNVWVLVRLGVLAAAVGLFVLIILFLPITADPAAYYFGDGLLVMGLVLAIAGYGALTSLGGRPLFRDA
jgi:serine/threonine-protein kinase